MKWSDTVASVSRYGNIAERIFGDAEIIWEHSEGEYDGCVNVLAKMPDGKFAHYEWTYGSCSGCDEWEARGLDDDQVEAEMRSGIAFFDSQDVVEKYLHLDEATVKDMAYPCVNSPTNGSVPEMMRALVGGIGGDFEAMAEAFAEWKSTNQTGR
jgi:hypothetical protein